MSLPTECPVRSRLAKMMMPAIDNNNNSMILEAAVAAATGNNNVLLGNNSNGAAFGGGGGGGPSNGVLAGVGAAVAAAAAFGYKSIFNRGTNGVPNDSKTNNNNTNIIKCTNPEDNQQQQKQAASPPAAARPKNNKNNVDLPPPQNQNGNKKHNTGGIIGSALAVPNSQREKQEKERIAKLPPADELMRDDRLVEADPQEFMDKLTSGKSNKTAKHQRNSSSKSENRNLNNDNDDELVFDTLQKDRAIAAAEAVCKMMEDEENNKNKKNPNPKTIDEPSTKPSSPPHKKTNHDNHNNTENNNNNNKKSVTFKNSPNHKNSNQQHHPQRIVNLGNPNEKTKRKSKSSSSSSGSKSSSPTAAVVACNDENADNITFTRTKEASSVAPSPFTVILSDAAKSPWLKLHMLGSGVDGVLYKGMHRDTGEIVCIKELHRHADRRAHDSLHRELEVFAKLTKRNKKQQQQQQNNTSSNNNQKEHETDENEDNHLIAIRCVEYIRPPSSRRLSVASVSSPNYHFTSNSNDDCSSSSSSSCSDSNNNNNNNMNHLHQNLVSCRVICEYCSFGTLHRLLADIGRAIPEPLLRSYARQLLLALRSLHEYKSGNSKTSTRENNSNNTGIIHRDIIPDNILVNEQGQLKVAGFGRARFAETMFPATPSSPTTPIDEDGNELECDDDGIDQRRHNDNSNSNRHGSMGMMMSGNASSSRAAAARSCGGSNKGLVHVLYMAPEAIRGQVSTFSDLWTLGATLVQLATGYLPWHSHLMEMANSRQGGGGIGAAATSQNPNMIFSVLKDTFGVMSMICNVGDGNRRNNNNKKGDADDDDSNDEENNNNNNNNHHPEMPQHLSDECKYFLKTLFQLEPRKRTSARELLENDVWLNSK